MEHVPFGPVEPNDHDRERVRQRFNGMYVQLDEVVEQEWQRVGQTDPPETVYHYTSARGVLGIINKKQIYLTDAFFLNDQSELIYGKDLAVACLRRRADNEANNLVKEFLSETADTFNPFDDAVFGFRYYVACFCSDGNLLSQWRAYATPGSGFALGIASAPLLEARHPVGGRLRAVFHRMEYLTSNQERLINAVIDWCKDRLAADLEGARDRFSQRVLRAGYSALLSIQLTGLFPQFKHPMFAEEKEWRLSTGRLPNEHRDRLQFRESGGNVVPYMLFDLALEDGRVPLREVILAPASEVDLRRRSVQSLLQQRGYPGDLRIIGSNIPLRVG